MLSLACISSIHDLNCSSTSPQPQILDLIRSWMTLVRSRYCCLGAKLRHFGLYLSCARVTSALDVLMVCCLQRLFLCVLRSCSRPDVRFTFWTLRAFQSYVEHFVQTFAVCVERKGRRTNPSSILVFAPVPSDTFIKIGMCILVVGVCLMPSTFVTQGLVLK